MADVSKLRIDDTTYDIKDENARRYLVVVNENPQSATKLVVTSSDSSIELALQTDIDSINAEITDLKRRVSALES